MSLFGQLFGRARLYEDLSAEIQAHIEEKIDELVASGMSRADAAFAARREFGNSTLIEERSREVWGWTAIETLIADIRFGLRQFRRNPSVPLVAMLSLAFGIGASTIVSSVIYAVLINPYPYKGAERMAHVHIFDKATFQSDLLLSSAQFQQFQHDKVLDGAIAVDPETLAATGGDLPESVSAAYFSPNAFEVFGIPPLMGREFSEADTKDALQSENIVVLSYPYWKSHYAGTKDVVGKSLQLERKSYTIIGVLPKRFAWWPRGDVYFPLKFSPDPNRTAMVFVRIKQGVSNLAAQAELQSSIYQLAKQTPDRFPKNFKILLVPLNSIFVGPFAGTLYVLFGAVMFLLIIGCANVSILLLSRGVAREHELAIRAAIGANRLRIVRQLLTESLTISFAGGLLGIALAYFGTEMVGRLLPVGTFPGEAFFKVSIPVLLFATMLAVLTGIVFGLWPALHFSSRPPNSFLQSGNRKLTGGVGLRRAHNVLIVGQTAMGLILLSGAGATLRVLNRLNHATLGYDPHNVGCIRVPLRDRTYTNWEQRLTYYDQIRQKVAGIPGISSAAIEFTPLPPASGTETRAEMRGTSDADGQVISMAQISQEYFSTLRIPLLRGRTWTQSETHDAAHVAVINTALAKHYWPNGDAIGQMIHLDQLKARTSWVLEAPGNDGWVQVIGVVGDTPNDGLRDPVIPTVYLPYTLVVEDAFDLVIRTRDNPRNYVHTVRQAIHSVDADQTISAVTTAEQRLDAEGLSRQRFVANVFMAFAFLGLALATVGLYSVVSYVVSQSTHEFAIRMALGAKRIHILRIVMRSSLISVVTGVAIGLAASLGLGQTLMQWVDGNARDPWMLGVASLVFLVIAMTASIIPAQRAVKVDPMVALRYE